MNTTPWFLEAGWDTPAGAARSAERREARADREHREAARIAEQEAVIADMDAALWSIPFIKQYFERGRRDDHELTVRTKNAYRLELQKFRTWCEANGVNAYNAHPAVIGTYLIEIGAGGLKTVRLAASAIAAAHRAWGLNDPTEDIRVRAARDFLLDLAKRLGDKPDDHKTNGATHPEETP